MDVKLINPFLNSLQNVLPQLGFSKISKTGISLKEHKVRASGIVLMLGIVGDIKGNVIYSMNMDSAKFIASSMMMGMPVDELDDMAKSALSELSNMLTANASMEFSSMGTSIDISTPTMLYGDDFEVNMNQKNIISVAVSVDSATMEIGIALE